MTATALLPTTVLLRLEHTQELLGCQELSELRTVFFLNVQTLLRLAELFLLTVEDLLQTCGSSLIRQFLLVPRSLLGGGFSSGARSTQGSHFALVALVKGFELGLLLIGELEVADQTLRLTRTHL